MKTDEYSRKPFTVNAVQVSLENVNEIAEWCGGTVEQVKTRLLGTETMLPCVKIPVQSSDNKGSFFKALLGMWIVERKNTFRVYKPNQFDATFQKKPTVAKMEQYGNVDPMRLAAVEEIPTVETVFETELALVPDADV